MTTSGRERQTVFVNDQEFELPYPLREDQEVSIFVDYLDGQRMWREHFVEQSTKIESRCIGVSLTRNLSFEFNPLNWQAS
jgi:hypothetical protein